MLGGFGGGFISEGAGFELGEDWLSLVCYSHTSKGWFSTSEAINCPLFEFLKRDVSCWRGFVEVEAVGVFLLFVEW